jgi:hypothetical protein
VAQILRRPAANEFDSLALVLIGCLLCAVSKPAKAQTRSDSIDSRAVCHDTLTFVGLIRGFCCCIFSAVCQVPSLAELSCQHPPDRRTTSQHSQSASWKPGGLYLHGKSIRIDCTTAAPRVHQQIPEPPCSAMVCQPEPKKPDFVTASGGQ